MKMCELSRERQAQTQSSGAPWRLAALLEHIEDPLQHLRRDAGPSVTYADDRVALGAFELDVNSAALRRVARGIAKQVCKNLHKPTVITDHSAAVRWLQEHTKPLPSLCNGRLQQFNRRLDHLLKFKPFQLERDIA